MVPLSNDITTLYNSNQGLVYTVLKTRIIRGNRQMFKRNCDVLGLDYEDFVQEGLLALYKAAQTYEESTGNKFSTHAYTQILYAMKKLMNRTQLFRYPADYGYLDIIQARKDAFSLEKKVTAETSENDQTYGDLLSNETNGNLSVEDKVGVRWAIEQLDDRSRTVVLLKNDGKTVQEIGSYFNVSGTMISRIHKRALKQLKTLLTA